MRYLFFLSTLFFCFCVEAQSPSVLYLTWIHDPTSTMTIQWHTSDNDPTSEVEYRKQGDEGWKKHAGLHALVSKTNLFVHTVELDGLESDSIYEFQLSPSEEIYRFKTLPQDLSHPVKFVIGGDAYMHLGKFRQMNAEIAKCSPDFVVLGGDIAYTNGIKTFFKKRGWEIYRWRKFLKEWTAQLITPEGLLIPLLPVLGNHDIRGISLRLRQQNPYFYQLFALPGNGLPYRSLECGNYLSLIMLDTGHGFHIQGQQTQWLEEQLKASAHKPYKLAAYHVGAYPSVYPYTGSTPRNIRNSWVPLFERYHLNAAFEHHNHAYKRSYPIKEGKVDPEGVIYMGDGSWGVRARSPKQEWYLDQVAKVNAVCVVTLTEESASIEALDNRGRIFDSVSIFPLPVSQEAGASVR